MAALAAIAVAQQGEREGRLAGRMGGERPRRSGTHQKTAFCRARHGRRAGPQQDEPRPRRLGREGEAAAGSQIIGAVRPAKDQDHTRQRGAARPFQRGLQHIAWLAQREMDDAFGRKAQFGEPRGERPAAFKTHLLMANKQERPPAAITAMQKQRQAKSRSGVNLARGVKFMKTGRGQHCDRPKRLVSARIRLI
jgi:hypothetical protein